MLDLIISSKAEADLIDIWLYIAEDQPVNADRFLDKLNETAKALAETPGMGVSRSSLSEGLRCFPVGNYILFCRVNPTTLEIVRFLSASRDVDNFMW
jgi:toxin ParE1/3/4